MKKLIFGKTWSCHLDPKCMTNFFVLVDGTLLGLFQRFEKTKVIPIKGVTNVQGLTFMSSCKVRKLTTTCLPPSDNFS